MMGMSEPPPILQYNTPQERQPDPHAKRKFLHGLVVAAGVAVVGGALGAMTMQTDPYLPIIVWLLFTPAAMALVGICLLPPRKTRMIGAGVLTVFGVIALIGGSLCLGVSR